MLGKYVIFAVMDGQKIRRKIEVEQKYQRSKFKELKYKTFLKSSQQLKIENLISQSEIRVARLKEKLKAFINNLPENEKIYFCLEI